MAKGQIILGFTKNRFKKSSRFWLCTSEEKMALGEFLPAPFSVGGTMAACVSWAAEMVKLKKEVDWKGAFFMDHEDKEPVPFVRSGKPGHKIQIGHVEREPWYEEAFYGEEPEDENEYTRNTTTWD